MQLGVQHVVRYLAHVEHLAQHLRNLDRCRAHQDRPSLRHHLLDFLNHGLVFLALCLVDAVVHVDADDGLVCRNHHNVQLVDVPELSCLGLRRSRHARQLVIHAEVVLQRDGGKRLCCGFHLDVLLCLDRLMQAVRPAAALHDASRLLVHNLHLSVHHHVVVVAVEHRVCLEQLQYGVYALRLHRVVAQQFVLPVQLLLVAQRAVVLKLRQLRRDVRQHEERRVRHILAQLVKSLVGQVDALQLLVDDEVQRFRDLRHPLVVLLHVYLLCRQHPCLDARLAQELDERLVLRQGLVAAVEREETVLHLFLVLRVDHLACVGKIFCRQCALLLHYLLHQRTEVDIQLVVVALRDRAGDDERRACVVNQHRVHLVHDGVVVLPLHEVLRAHGHVVTQIVEAELVVRAEGDVCQICLAACFGVRLVLVDAVHAQSVEHVERSHPFRVSFRQIVVDGHHVHAVAGQRVQEHRQCRHQCLSLARRHLGNLALVQHHAAKQLHVVVDHVPCHLAAACHPVVLVDGLVALNPHEVVLGCQLAVEVVGCDHNLLVFAEAACRVLHDGEHRRQNLVQSLLVDLENFLLRLVYLCEDWLAVFQLGGLDCRLQLVHLCTQVACRVADVALYLFGLGTQPVVVQLRDVGVGGFDFVHPRLNLLHVAC